MRIRISPDGSVMTPDTGRKLGSILQSPLSSIAEPGEVHLEIQLPNTHCNIGGPDPTTGQQACLMCPRNSEHFLPEYDRGADIVASLRGKLAAVPVLRVAGDAEPFWKNRIFEMLEGLGIGGGSNVKIFATTNGTLIDKHTAERWFEAVPQSELSFSVDAATPGTYLKLRRVAEFDRVVANLDNYCRTRDPDHHIAVLRNNINTINIDEVEEMIRMTKDYFFHFVVLSLTRPIQRSLNEICLNEQNAGRFRDAQNKAKELAEELGVNVVFSGNWPG